MGQSRVHFLGIGGSGASAAAAIAEAQGFEVDGCDLDISSEFTTPFSPNQLQKGHSASHIGSGVPDILTVTPAIYSLKLQTGIVVSKVDILAVTPAIYSLDPDNPELLEAKKKGVEILTWQEFMGKYLMKDKFVIAISGTHGKTTTTAMIAKLLEDANLDPTVELGAIVPKWGTNYRIPRQKVRGREYFVIEADEYNDNFLAFHPDISVVTNIDMDHPEYFKDFESYKESFKKFLLQTKGTIVANMSDSGIGEVLKVVMKTSNNQTYHGRGTNGTYLDYSKNELNFPLKIPGDFNKLNAQAAFQVGLLLGIDPKIIKQSLESYSGVGRRFEYLGDFKGAKVYSDFGHHPTEIKETMQAAREKFPKLKIWLIYEPHMFTRTKALFDDFVKVFKEIPVDQIIITDIYQSREIDKGLVTSQQLSNAVHSNTSMYQSKTNLKNFLEKKIQKGDILFFMGAGDIDKIAKELLRS